MRVALFATGGEIPELALHALNRVATVVAIIRPRPRPGVSGALRGIARRWLRGPGPPDSLSRLTMELGIPEWPMAGASDATLASRMAAARLDLACLATFPWPLPVPVIRAPRLGSVNVHASVLPRHRGPNPWFWTYHADDREAGVTVHVCEARVDRGAILAQARWPLARGHSVKLLHGEVAVRGAALLPELIANAETILANARPQEHDGATAAPRVRPDTPMIDPSWPTERTWHFLSGLVGQYQEPLRTAGRPLRYSRVPGYELAEPRSAPGSVERERGRASWKLWCGDGFVRLLDDDA